MDLVPVPLTFSAATIALFEAVSVANIDSPTELNAITGTLVGERRVCYQAIAGDNVYTIYYYDSSDVSGASAPYVMAASGSGFWIASGGKYTNSAVKLRSTLDVAGVITSSLATGTAPFSIASTTVVPNLNASLLGGNAVAAFLLQSVATTKGDIVAATGAGALARLGVGTDTWVLTADSSQTSGIKWAAPASAFNPASPGPIGGTTPGSGAFTSLSASTTLGVTGLSTLTGGLTTPAVITSTIVTGTAPFTVASTTAVANLNASLLLGSTWASPGAIGGTAASTGKFTSVTNTGLTATQVLFAGTGGLESGSADMTFASGSGTLTLGNATASHVISSTAASTSTTTGALKVAGGVGVAGAINVASASRFGASGTANSLLHLKQSGDATAGGARFERTGTTDYQDVFISPGAGSLNDALTFYPSFLGAPAMMIDRSGIVYAASKLLIGTTTDAGNGVLQVTGAIRGTTGLALGCASTVTSGGTTTLTATSALVQVFTGTSAQTVNLPSASALGANVSQMFVFKNLSSVSITVSAGTEQINLTTSGVNHTMVIGTFAWVILVSDGSGAWQRLG